MTRRCSRCSARSSAPVPTASSPTSRSKRPACSAAGRDPPRMPQPLRAFHVFGDQFAELDALPDALPPTGYLWIAASRSAFESAIAEIQTRLLSWTGAQLFDLHISDLLNKQATSTFDYTSAYDLLVFRRLAAGAIESVDADGPPTAGRQNAIAMIDTSPVGFVVFDRVLLSVHPTDCQVREFFAQRLQSQGSSGDGRGR